MTYLRIRNWERYQHYKNRRPPWVKLYVELLDDTEIRALPIATRLLWDQLLLLNARLNEAIPNDSEEIARLTRIDHEDVVTGIAQLLKGRWLKEIRTPRHASAVLADRKQNASPHARPRTRGEAEKEKDPPNPPPSGGNHSRSNGTNPRAKRAHAKRLETVGSYLRSCLADDWPHDTLVDELKVRFGLQHDEAEDLIQSV